MVITHDFHPMKDDRCDVLDLLMTMQESELEGADDLSFFDFPDEGGGAGKLSPLRAMGPTLGPGKAKDLPSQSPSERGE